jgi:transcription antitermination factor NusG
LGVTKATPGGGADETVSMSDFDLDLREGERWFVAQTLAQREKLAAFHLGAQGFRSFLPRFHKTVRHARQLREVLAPVFPGYIFVIVNVQRDRWRSINGTFGVARLVSADSGPLAVPVGVVEALIVTLDEAGRVRLGGELKPGQAVRILSGPFAQALGLLERLDGRGRVRVLLNIMGGPAPVMIDRANLTAA